ncbi:hypothetical protein [Nonomuraea sp. NPDC049709]|uniref:hypothetical protein n=1 Tax=Nonomuraea sp. NPDC049709 TaxID=3154736 RepID=UPI003446BB2B
MNVFELPDLVVPYLDEIQLGIQIAGTLLGLWILRRLYRWGWPRFTAAPEHALTIVAAAIATGVSAQGMWRFTGDVLGLDGPLRILLFAFIEVAIITSAVRARRNMRENFSAGIDGIAVWALTVLTAVLSSMDARSLPEAVFRLAAPLVAAWLWERGMAIERHRIRGTKGINWRVTPERILVRLGLAEPTDRTATEVDAQRRTNRIALAVLRADDLQAGDASERRQRRAVRAFRKALAQGVEHINLASDPAQQQAVLAKIDTLRSTDALLARRRVADWASPAEDTPPELPAAAPARRLIVVRTERRTEAPPAVVQISRRFEFTRRPAPEPVRVLRRAFTFQPGAARTAPVRRLIVVRTRPVPAAPELVDRSVFVREITADILAAAARNEKWTPNYDALMTRSGRRRSWCEKAVADARKAVFGTDARTEGAAA